MKRIILSLLCPLSLMAMEQQSTTPQNNEPLYAGIVTHMLSAVHNKKTISVTPYEQDIIVYEYNKNNAAFDYIDRQTTSHVASEPAFAIKTMPDFSGSQIRITRAFFEESTDATLWIDGPIEAQYLGSCFVHSPSSFKFQLPFGKVAFINDRITSTNRAKGIFTPHFTESNHYMPGHTYINAKVDDASNYGKIAKTAQLIEMLPHELTTDNVTRALKNPERQLLGAVIAVLSLKKQDNGRYVPSKTDKLLSEALELKSSKLADRHGNDNDDDSDNDNDSD